MAGLASVGEDVLDGAEVGQVLDFRAQLLPYFADDALTAVLAEVDGAAQRAIEFVAGRRVTVLGDKDPVAIPEDAYHDGSDLSGFHCAASSLCFARPNDLLARNRHTQFGSSSSNLP